MIKIKKVLGQTRQYLLADGRVVSIADVKAGRIKDIVLVEVKKPEDKRSELKKTVKKKAKKKKWSFKNEY